jgi:hypothetical protein
MLGTTQRQWGISMSHGRIAFVLGTVRKMDIKVSEGGRHGKSVFDQISDDFTHTGAAVREGRTYLRNLKVRDEGTSRLQLSVLKLLSVDATCPDLCLVVPNTSQTRPNTTTCPPSAKPKAQRCSALDPQRRSVHQNDHGKFPSFYSFFVCNFLLTNICQSTLLVLETTAASSPTGPTGVFSSRRSQCLSRWEDPWAV